MSFLKHFPHEAVRNVNVWAGQAEMANLRPDPARDLVGLKYPDGDQRGQGGWNAALMYRSLEDLAEQLERGVRVPETFYPGDVSSRGAPPIRRGEISRLAIMCHGQQGGELRVNGKQHARVLRPDTLRSFHSALHRIGLYTRPDVSTILLMGCMAGQGNDGTRLLTELSLIWPGRLVVGFTTIGYRHPMHMAPHPAQDPFELPGMRDTNVESEVLVNPRVLDRLWSDLVKMPWASEDSPHAKIARSGVLLKCPPGDACMIPARSR